MSSDENRMDANERSGCELTTSEIQESEYQKSQTVGPYKLLKVLGEGGMGTVWMAEQERPVRRRVALKLIKVGLDNKQIVARFEAERQALAMMNHENIAKVLDAGTTSSGQPYFVMELVQGIPFTKYCDQHKCTIKERLELFIPVCRAIQHAHQKGIIHRDLKPSNVLVSLCDGKAVPKVIDFGLAKALQHTTRLTDKTMFTEFGQVVGTLQYMSPEQAEMDQQDIDTRTDIYSLGVMLYELLTGSTPIDEGTLKQQAILKILETIREKEPPRPSARLSNITNESVSGISDQRRIEASKLKNILRGELDWIVMKSIEKNRSRRYETANGFAEDLTRYLAGEVVSARPPSVFYRVRKFVQRNKWQVAAFITISNLLLIGLCGTAYGVIHARWELDKRKAAEISLKEVEASRTQLMKALQEAERAKAAEAEARSLAEEQEKIATRTKEMAQAQQLFAEEQRQKELSKSMQQDDAIAVLVDATWQLVKFSRPGNVPKIKASTLVTLQQNWDRSHSISQIRLLSLLEYRSDRFDSALKYGFRAMELGARESQSSGSHPIDLALIAMSHFKLGNSVEAKQFRQLFDAEMKREEFKADPECLSFAEEVQVVFAMGDD